MQAFLLGTLQLQDVKHEKCEENSHIVTRKVGRTWISFNAHRAKSTPLAQPTCAQPTSSPTAVIAIVARRRRAVRVVVAWRRVGCALLARVRVAVPSPRHHRRRDWRRGIVGPARVISTAHVEIPVRRRVVPQARGVTRFAVVASVSHVPRVAVLTRRLTHVAGVVVRVARVSQVAPRVRVRKVQGQRRTVPVRSTAVQVVRRRARATSSGR